MITKDEKRFLKWLLIAALLGIAIWQLTQRGILRTPGEGVFLVLFAVGFFTRVNPKAAEKQRKAEYITYTAQHRKFGRWTTLARCGHIVLMLVGVMVLVKFGTVGPMWRLLNWRGTWGFAVFILTFWTAVLWELYLHYLVAEYKAELKEEQDDGKTL
jgi:Ni/Fe-hydrogenase subunit HybB-like protein